MPSGLSVVLLFPLLILRLGECGILVYEKWSAILVDNHSAIYGMVSLYRRYCPVYGAGRLRDE